MAGLKVNFSIKDKDKGYRKLVREVFNGKRAEIAVGILEGPGNQAHKERLPNGQIKPGKQTVLEVATAHELGQGVPRRSFLVDYFTENQARMVAQAKALMRTVVTGKQNQRTILEKLGLKWTGEIQQRIAQGIPPALAQVTIDKKGSSTPLIDTGQLRASISYRIKGYGFQAIGNAVANAAGAAGRKKAAKILRTKLKQVKKNTKKLSKKATKEKKALVKKARAKIAKTQKNFQKRAKTYQKRAARLAKQGTRLVRKTAKKTSKRIKKALK